MLDSQSYFDDLDALIDEENELPAIPHFPTIFRLSTQDEKEETTTQE